MCDNGACVCGWVCAWGRKYNEEIEARRLLNARKAEELKPVPQVRQSIKPPVPVQQSSPVRSAAATSASTSAARHSRARLSYDDELDSDDDSRAYHHHDDSTLVHSDSEMVPNPHAEPDEDDDVAVQIRQLGAGTLLL